MARRTDALTDQMCALNLRCPKESIVNHSAQDQNMCFTVKSWTPFKSLKTEVEETMSWGEKEAKLLARCSKPRVPSPLLLRYSSSTG